MDTSVIGSNFLGIKSHFTFVILASLNLDINLKLSRGLDRFIERSNI